jgi:hypothetical protein
MTFCQCSAKPARICQCLAKPSAARVMSFAKLWQNQGKFAKHWQNRMTTQTVAARSGGRRKQRAGRPFAKVRQNGLAGRGGEGKMRA